MGNRKMRTLCVSDARHRSKRKTGVMYKHTPCTYDHCAAILGMEIQTDIDTIGSQKFNDGIQ